MTPPQPAANPFYLRYSEEVLYGGARARLAAAQAAVPPGQPLVAWASTPWARGASPLRFLQGFKASADLVYDDGGIAVLKRRTAGSPLNIKEPPDVDKTRLPDKFCHAGRTLNGIGC